MGDAAKKWERMPPVTIVSVREDLVRDWFEGVARQFLRSFGLIDYDLVLQAQVPGSFRVKNKSYEIQQAIIEWINKYGHRSGIRDDVFFVSVPGVPVRMRVDTEARPHSFDLRFRAISR